MQDRRVGEYYWREPRTIQYEQIEMVDPEAEEKQRVWIARKFGRKEGGQERRDVVGRS